MAPSITIAYVRMHVGVLSICFRKLVRPMIKTGRMYEKRVKLSVGWNIFARPLTINNYSLKSR